MNLPIPLDILPMLAALIAGFVVGWMMPAPWQRERGLSDLRGTSAGSDPGESAGPTGKELDELQSLVQQLTTRAEAAETARDQSKAQAEQLGTRVEEIQTQLEEAADHILELERARRSAELDPSPRPLSPDDEDAIREIRAAGSPSAADGPLGFEIERSTMTIRQPVAPGVTGENAELEFELEPEKPLPVAVPDAESAVREDAREGRDAAATGDGDATVAADPGLDVLTKGAVEATALEEPAPTGPTDTTDTPADSGVARPLREAIAIGDDLAERFEIVGVRSTLDLVQKCSTRKSVNRLAMSMSLDPGVLSGWVWCADLLRVESLTTEQAQLLLEIGVASVQQLGRSDARELAGELAAKGRLSPAPSAEMVEDWIQQARSMQPLLRQ